MRKAFGYLAMLLLAGCAGGGSSGGGGGGGGGGGNLLIPSGIYYVNLGTSTNSIAAYSSAPVAGGGIPSALSGSPFSTGHAASAGSPFGLAFKPGGSVLYAVNDSGTVSSFTVNNDGTLTALNSVSTGGTAASGVAADPAASFAAVANSGTNSIQMFTVTVGGLSALGSPVTTGGLNAPAAIAFSPDGSHLYAGNAGGTNVGISAFSVSNLGALSAVSGSPFGTGGNLTQGLAISPNGADLYAAIQDTNKIAIFAVGGNGSLTAQGTVATCTAPIGIVLNNAGTHLYVACAGSNAVDVFTVNGSAVAHLAGPYGTQNLKTAMVSLSGDGSLLVALDENSFGVTLLAVHADGTLNGGPASLYSDGTNSGNPSAVLVR